MVGCWIMEGSKEMMEAFAEFIKTWKCTSDERETSSDMGNKEETVIDKDQSETESFSAEEYLSKDRKSKARHKFRVYKQCPALQLHEHMTDKILCKSLIEAKHYALKTGKTTKEVIKRNVKHKSKGKESKYGCKSEGKGKKKSTTKESSLISDIHEHVCCKYRFT